MQRSLPVGRQRSASGVPEKNNGGGGLLLADGQAASASGSSVDSQTISGGPPLIRQLMYMAVDEMVLSC